MGGGGAWGGSTPTPTPATQMVVGVAVQAMSAYFYVTQTTDTPCAVTASNLTAGVLMYGSYLLLFVSFAFARFRPTTKSSPREENGTMATMASGKVKRG